MPALFTRMSTRPYAATTLVMNAWTCPRSATSTANPAALPPAALISSTRGGIAPSFLSAMIAKAPSLVTRCAIALPMPEAEPVTIATFSFKRIGISSLFGSGIDMRAVRLANIGEELARGRRIDQVLAREAAGDPAHPDGELGDLDNRDKTIEDWCCIDLMHSGISQKRHQATAGWNKHFRAFFDTAPRAVGELADDLYLGRVIAQCQIKDPRPIELHLLD